MKKFKRGDMVKVWSLQSFSDGGFLNGEPAIVKQDQIGESVILVVVRKIKGTYKLDTSYEVYAKQCEIMEEFIGVDDYTTAQNDLKNYYRDMIKIDNNRNK